MPVYQQQKLIEYLKDRYSEGHYFGHEIIVALADLVNRSQIDQSDARQYLKEIFNGDISAIYRSLKTAREIVEPEIIDKILA